MAHKRKATGAAVLTLFDTPYQHAVSDMVEQFRRQLSEASTPEERREISLAIESWMAAHAAPQPFRQAGSRRSTRTSNRKL